MQRHCLAELGRAEALAPGSEERKRLLDALIAYIDGQRELSAEGGLDGYVLWFRSALGRARALAGDADGARRELDAVTDFAPGPVSEEARNYVDELRMNAYRLKARTAFEAHDYEGCIRAVDDMLAPVTGFPWALSDDRVNAAAIYRAKALLLKERPDVARAVEQCMRVIREGRGGWPNNARELLYEIHAERQHAFPPGLATPAILREVARGAYLFALDAVEEGERQRLLDEAIALFQEAIVACRGDRVGLATRLEHEPRALLEMGVVYSNNELWYESMFCFEAVVSRFSRERVGQLLAGDARFGKEWRAIRKGIPDAAPAELHRRFYREMLEDSPLSALLRRHELRLAMSARNLCTAARKRRQESRSDFDDRLLRRAAGILIELGPAYDPGPPRKARERPGDALTDEDDMVF
ncbi:MAG: hypothetical protein ACYS9X_17150 [Planctomycetota bacterium]